MWLWLACSPGMEGAGLAKEAARDQHVRCLGSLPWSDWLAPWAGKPLYMHWVYRAVRSRLTISVRPWDKSCKFLKRFHSHNITARIYEVQHNIRVLVFSLGESDHFPCCLPFLPVGSI